MAKKKVAAGEPATEAAAAAATSDPTNLTYVGPRDAESPRYGALVPGRVYQETDPAFAAYLVATHPDHWARA
jgi:hypothetical protein